MPCYGLSGQAVHGQCMVPMELGDAVLEAVRAHWVGQ